MAKQTKTSAPVDTFARDKAEIIQLFDSALSFDWPHVKELLVRYQTQTEKFAEIKTACYIHQITKFMASYTKPEKLTQAQALHIVTFDSKAKANKGKSLPEPHKLAKKSAFNAWSYFTAKAGLTFARDQSRNRNPTGANGSAPKAEASTPTASPAPLAIESITVNHFQGLAALYAEYDKLRLFFIRLQSANAKIMDAPAFACHEAIISAINTLMKSKPTE